jgi:hypothetical protein
MGDAVKDSALAFAEEPAVAFSDTPGVAFPRFLGESCSHSKASEDWSVEDVITPQLLQILRGFSSFFWIFFGRK